MFALIDCNNFYASCERVFQPQYEGKAVVILSNNDGCVIARSNEAKVLGIPMGAPAFKFRSEFKKYNIKVFSSNYPLYGDMSHRVMTILEEYTPNVEIYSIDEAFLKFEGFDFGVENGESHAITGDVEVPESVKKEFQVVRLIEGYRTRGHLFTKTNPIRNRRVYSLSYTL